MQLLQKKKNAKTISVLPTYQHDGWTHFNTCISINGCDLYMNYSTIT